jgi:hypothetical protein
MNENQGPPGRKTSPSKGLENVDEGGAQPDNGVGYRRPPKHGRVQPGKAAIPVDVLWASSRSPTLFARSSGRKVTVTENGRTRRIPRLEAILLRAASEASRGGAASLRLLRQFAERYDESAQTGAEQQTIAADDVSILRRYLADLTSLAPRAIGPETSAEDEHER